MTAHADQQDQQFLIMHTAKGDFDLSKYKNAEAAWDAHIPPSNFGNIGELEYKNEYIGSLVAYTLEEVAKEHIKGHQWPTELKLIDPDNFPVFASDELPDSDENQDYSEEQEAQVSETQKQADTDMKASFMKAFFESDGYKTEADLEAALEAEQANKVKPSSMSL